MNTQKTSRDKIGKWDEWSRLTIYVITLFIFSFISESIESYSPLIVASTLLIIIEIQYLLGK